ncbi:MAG: cytochrome P450 [Chloroflexota bacterium]
MTKAQCPVSLPIADGPAGLQALKSLAQRRSLLGALEAMHTHVGDIFQITLPGFTPAVFVGPETNRQVLVSRRDEFLWRTETDPVTTLLRHGVLVEDGEAHRHLRKHMDPLLQRRQVTGHVDDFCRYTDHVVAGWKNGRYDMLIEMRKLALVILMGTLFKVEFGPELDRLWSAILGVIKYISPGLWIISPKIPRPGYQKAIDQMDEYLYQIIRDRRANPGQADDLLGYLVTQPEFSDDLIRDQLLTMLIAGHDTSTALLAWVLYLLGKHPEAMDKARAEVDTVLGSDTPTMTHVGQLHYLDQVIKETLRLYPPIHIGNRMAKADMTVNNYHVPQGTRVMYSIYLSHRHPAYWSEPEQFCPERFTRTAAKKRPPFTYVPFGGGPRNCIGATFAQIEAKVVLARILQAVDLHLISKHVRASMGATLEPHPGVVMQVQRRERSRV